MVIVFFGTSGVCVPFLERLHSHFKIPLIVTQPDAMGGRNRKQVIVPPVRTFALERRIESIQPETLKDDAVVERLKGIAPEIGVVISYGKLIPRKIFEIPTRRMVNVHFSLLPFYRGAAPVQRAIENGDRVTGISIFEIEKKMDAGDIWAQREFEILPDDSTESLWERMSLEGAPFLVETLHSIFDNKISKIPQDHEKATYAPSIDKEEGKVNWELTSQRIYDKFRAFTPWPGLNCCADNKEFKLTKIRVSPDTHTKTPGQVLSWDKQGLKICCGAGSVLEILELQPQGKKPMSPYCFCMGNELPDCFL